MPFGDTRTWVEASSTAMESPGHRMLWLAALAESGDTAATRRKLEVRMVSSLIMVRCNDLLVLLPGARATTYIIYVQAGFTINPAATYVDLLHLFSGGLDGSDAPKRVDKFSAL
jgi:hypothetical protein